jgi:hypothetical protein
LSLYPDSSCSPSLEPLLSMAFTLHTTIRNALVTLFVLVLFSVLYDAASSLYWRQYSRIDGRGVRCGSTALNTHPPAHGGPTTLTKLVLRCTKALTHILLFLLIQDTITRSTTGAARWLSGVFANDLDRRQCRLREAVGYLCMATVHWLTFLNILTVAVLLYLSRKSLSRRDHADSFSRRSAWMQGYVRKMADTLLAVPMTVVGSQRRVSAGNSWMPLLTLSVQAILSLGVYWAVDALVSLVAKRAAKAGN